MINSNEMSNDNFQRNSRLLSVRFRDAGFSVLTTFRLARVMTMLGISGVELPDRRPYPVSKKRPKHLKGLGFRDGKP